MTPTDAFIAARAARRNARLAQFAAIPAAVAETRTARLNWALESREPGAELGVPVGDQHPGLAAVAAVRRAIAELSFPAETACRWVGTHRAAGSGAHRMTEGRVDVELTFTSPSGVKRAVLVPVMVHEGRVLTPSTFIQDGEFKLISQAVFDEFLERNTLTRAELDRRTMFSPPPDQRVHHPARPVVRPNLYTAQRDPRATTSDPNTWPSWTHRYLDDAAREFDTAMDGPDPDPDAVLDRVVVQTLDELRTEGAARRRGLGADEAERAWWDALDAGELGGALREWVGENIARAPAEPCEICGALYLPSKLETLEVSDPGDRDTPPYTEVLQVCRSCRYPEDPRDDHRREGQLLPDGEEDPFLPEYREFGDDPMEPESEPGVECAECRRLVPESEIGGFVWEPRDPYARSIYLELCEDCGVEYHNDMGELRRYLPREAQVARDVGERAVPETVPGMRVRLTEDVDLFHAGGQLTSLAKGAKGTVTRDLDGSGRVFEVRFENGLLARLSADALAPARR